MKTILPFLLLLGAIFLNTKSFAQEVRASMYQTSILTKVGVEYEFENDRWKTELRLGSDINYLDWVNIEIIAAYNIITKEQFKFYTGIGFSVNLIDGIVIPIGIEFVPFKEEPKFSILIETEPSFDGDIVLQNSWGFKYRF